jgi:hypothetical protein
MMENNDSSRRCGRCRFWQHLTDHTGACRLRAPAPGESRDEVAHWAHTFNEDRCGEWEESGSGAPGRTQCGNCVYWSFKTGGLTPVDMLDQLAQWWARAGHCQRLAPIPSELPGHKAFWRATHWNDGCFDGKTRSA